MTTCKTCKHWTRRTYYHLIDNKRDYEEYLADEPYQLLDGETYYEIDSSFGDCSYDKFIYTVKILGV